MCGYQALQLAISLIPFCFGNFEEVALVVVVCLTLTAAPANIHLIEISKVTSVTVPILSCLFLHSNQWLPFLLQRSNCGSLLWWFPAHPPHVSSTPLLKCGCHRKSRGVRCGLVRARGAAFNCVQVIEELR